jgi:hypothetical protein
VLARELGIHPAPQTRAVLAGAVADTRPAADHPAPQADLGTLMDATLTLFEHQRFGRAVDGLDDAVRVVSALLPTRKVAPPQAVDPRRALQEAHVRLCGEFEGVLAPETVRRFLYSGYEGLLATSTVRTYLPLLAERSTRRQLRALADAGTRTPTVVFRHAPGTAIGRMAPGFLRTPRR